MKYSVIKNLITAVAMVLFALTGFGQPSGLAITGNVKDSQNQQNIDGVSIQLTGQVQKFAATKSDGTFEIPQLAPGDYQLRFRIVGYKEYVTDTFTVAAGDTKQLQIRMEPEGKKIEEVEIRVRSNRESESSLLAERQKASMVMQKVGSQELSRKGLGNVGEGVSKVVGVAKVGDDDIFVRGLGDRYNNATLNGLPIPSPNPDVKMISLEIFPSQIVKNIEVLKSFHSAYYGDFSGGNIDIVTKDFPEKAFFKVDLSFGANSQSTGKAFLGSNRNFVNLLGFSRQNRAMPDVVEGLQVYDSYNEGNGDPGFKTSWSPEQFQAPINSGLAVSGGDVFKYDNDRQFAYLFSLSTKNDYSFKPGKSAWYNAQQESIYDFDTETFNYETNTTGLLSLQYQANRKTQFGVLGLFVNDSKNGVINNFGDNWDLGEIYGRRNTLLQNTLMTGQVFAKHEFSSQDQFEASLGYTNTNGSIPDRTQWMAEARGDGQYQFSTNGITDINRYFSDLHDHDGAFHAEWNRRYDDADGILKGWVVGFDSRIKRRKFDARQIDADARQIRTLFEIDELDAILSPNRLGIGNSTTWRYKEVPNEQNKYRSEMEIYAPYIHASLGFGEKWQLEAGLRFEQSRQSTDYKLSRDIISAPYRNNTIKGSDLLPGVSLKYLVDTKSNLLLSFSKTVARPLFTEAAPFRYNESAATAQRQGNPSLKNGHVYNVDLRYDFFPNPGELVSVAIFGKQLYDPIELVRLSGSEPMFSYVNSDRAIVAGVEVELNKKLTDRLVLGINAAYQYTEIEFDKDRLSEKGVPFYPTNFKRPLYGASPFMVNADLGYKARWSDASETQFTAAYGVFGKRLFLAGADGTGDIYEMPVHNLNFVINTKLNSRFGFDISLKNLLNPEMVYQQEFAANNLDYMRIRDGISAGLSLHYNF